MVMGAEVESTESEIRAATLDEFQWITNDGGLEMWGDYTLHNMHYEN